MITTWHGWLMVEHSEGYRDRFIAEYVEDGRRVHLDLGISPGAAIEWWDERVRKLLGNPEAVAKLLPTPLGAYRVYTGSLPGEAEKPMEAGPQLRSEDELTEEDLYTWAEYDPEPHVNTAEKRRQFKEASESEPEGRITCSECPTPGNRHSPACPLNPDPLREEDAP